jgi:tetratricopeptide (TPR) repeat protein
MAILISLFRYTRECFLYKMLNKACFDQEKQMLYKLHFFIKDLHAQIEELHALYKPSLESQIFTVFRGLTLTETKFNEIIRQNEGELIGFDCFLSTSLQKAVAERFALLKKVTSDLSILLQIQIDADKLERPFAYIKTISEMAEEDEVLFSIGTVFHIDNVAKSENADGIWVVQLSSVSENDPRLKTEVDKTQNALLKFFKEIDQALKSSNSHQRIAANLASIASTYYQLKKHEDSLAFYKKANDELSKLESPDQLTQAAYISNIAMVYRTLGNFDEALKFYEAALEIRNNGCQSSDPVLINTLHTVGHIHREKHDWEKARNIYQKVLKIVEKLSDDDTKSIHTYLTLTYMYIAITYHKQNEFQRALDNFSSALDYQRKNVSDLHPVLAYLYNNIGAMHFKLKQYANALENHLSCLKIEQKLLPSKHPHFISTYHNISLAYKKLETFDEAIKYAEMKVNLLRESNAHTNELNEALQYLKILRAHL